MTARPSAGHAPDTISRADFSLFTTTELALSVENPEASAETPF
jgi:hypothetical protein